MKIVVAGATGATGKLVVEQAVKAGDDVTALIRDPVRYQGPGEVDTHVVDLLNDSDLELPDDTDVVISTLGKSSYSDPSPVCEHGVRRLLGAMRRREVSRIVAISASPVLKSGAGHPWFFRRAYLPYVRWSGRNIYSDLAKMESLLRSAGSWCDWTIVRPGFLEDTAESGGYQLSPGRNVHGNTQRSDLAAALLDLAADTAAYRQDYGIGSRTKLFKKAKRD